MIVQYVRDESGQPYGVVVATDKNKIGVSQCNPLDKFNKRIALEIATGRAVNGRRHWSQYLTEKESMNMKSNFRKTVDTVEKRSQKYFKG